MSSEGNDGKGGVTKRQRLRGHSRQPRDVKLSWSMLEAGGGWEGWCAASQSKQVLIVLWQTVASMLSSVSSVLSSGPDT